MAETGQDAASGQGAPAQIPATRVDIVDIRMPFWSMVMFMVKAAIAFIPAFIILAVIGSMVFGMLGLMI